MRSAKIVETVIDGEFLFIQSEIVEADPDVVLRFGPLSSPLSSLFIDGWRIVCSGKVKSIYSNVMHRFYLEKGGDGYRIGSISPHNLSTASSFQPFIKQNRLFSLSPDVRLALSPLDALLRQYPKAKKTVMIGNMTAKEFVRAEVVAAMSRPIF